MGFGGYVIGRSNSVIGGHKGMNLFHSCSVVLETEFGFPACQDARQSVIGVDIPKELDV